MLTTRVVTTDFLEPAKIEEGQVEGWRQIEDPATLAVQPVVTMYYSDMLSVGEEGGEE